MDPDIYYVALLCATTILGGVLTKYGPRLLARNRMSSKVQFTPARQGVIFGKDKVEPTPRLWDIGPNLTKILLILAMALQTYVIYITRETKAEVEEVKAETMEAKSEAMAAKQFGERNAARLKKVADDRLAQENKSRDLRGLPPIKPEVED